MKKEILVILLAVCLIFAVAAFAAEKDKSARGSAAASSERIFTAGELNGTTLQDSKGVDLGEIKNIVLDTESGTAYALVSVGEKLYPVPIKSLSKSRKNFRVDIDKEQFLKLPTVTKNNMRQEMASRGFDTRVYHHFGIAAPWESEKQTK